MKIFGFISKSITVKLLLLFLATSIIPLGIIGALSLINISNDVRSLEFQNRRSIGNLKTTQITTYLNERFTELDVLAKSGDALSNYYLLAEYFQLQEEGGDAKFDIQSEQYAEVYQEVDHFFRIFTESFEFYDMFMISAENGIVMYSVKRESDLGEVLSGGDLGQSGLGRLLEQVKIHRMPLIIDYSYYQPSDSPAAFLGAPLFNDAGDLVAVIGLQIDHYKINEIMLEDADGTASGRTYLVGEDYLMRSDSRHIDGNSILEREIRTSSVEKALANESGVQIIEDSSGSKVLSYYSYIVLKKKFRAGFNWVIISEIDADEAFAPVRQLARDLILLMGIILLCVLVVSFLLANSFTRPIRNITVSARAMAKGILDVPAKTGLRDEIGQLGEAFSTVRASMQKQVIYARQIAEGDLTVKITPLSDKDEMGQAFAGMVNVLQDQIGEIIDVSQLLSAANNQLAATVSQLTTSTQESSTTITEISSTLNEVKQTAEISADKAKGVSELANKSVQISERGLHATEDSIDGMTSISEQVRKISDTIIKLSDQSQAIGEITSSVKAIAEQSNLLAVNASIEAVKAGEYGKGFAVVAEEIRQLSDQSKLSARQINDILLDVRKSISDAVMATEEGGKAVDKGMELSEAAGDSITLLADNISDAAQSSVQIATSSAQQLTGYAELNTAMDNIRVTVNQNSETTALTRDAISGMRKIVHRLDELISQYKIESGNEK